MTGKEGRREEGEREGGREGGEKNIDWKDLIRPCRVRAHQVILDPIKLSRLRIILLVMSRRDDPNYAGLLEQPLGQIFRESRVPSMNAESRKSSQLNCAGWRGYQLTFSQSYP